MKSSELAYLRCPKCLEKLELKRSGTKANAFIETGELICSNCFQSFAISQGIPQLFLEEEILEKDRIFTQQADDYSKNYEKMLKVLGLLLFQWEPRARHRFIKRLGIEKGSNILDICTGTGNNLPALKKYTTDDSELVAIDLSQKMIQKCQEKIQKKDIPAAIHRGNALQLPYRNEFFDVVISSGGINTFGDRKKGLEEMIRVARSGGLVIISDEGLKPEKRDTWLGRRLIAMNNLYTMEPPLHLLPDEINPEIEYIYRDTFYVLKFWKP